MHQSLLEQRLGELADNHQRTDQDSNLFLVYDSMMFLSLAAQSLSQDDFSRCFAPKPRHHPTRLDTAWWWIWAVGVGFRYGVLLPVRVIGLVFGIGVVLVGLVVARVLGREEVERKLFTFGCKLWLCSYGAIVRHHGLKPRLPSNHPHLFVANHTSFNDYIVLSSHQYPHGVVAQTHGGLFGVLMRWVLEAYGSLSFNRNEQRDRVKIAERIKKQINNEKVFAPLLIFPEGTCVNNESTVLFHKGAFELNCTVCPVGIKYNKRLSDPYWNTREQSFTQHVLYLLSRWMMVVDVWWLPPQDRLPGESAIAFADRVKSLISTAAGLKNRSWNGYLKNVMRKLDRDRMHSASQTTYAVHVKRLHSHHQRSTESLIDDSLPEEPIIASEPISIVKRRRHSLPTSTSSSSFPPWLPEAAVIDARNSVLRSGDAADLVQMNSLKETVVMHYRKLDSVDEAGVSSSESSITSA